MHNTHKRRLGRVTAGLVMLTSLAVAAPTAASSTVGAPTVPRPRGLAPIDVRPAAAQPTVERLAAGTPIEGQPGRQRRGRLVDAPRGTGIANRYIVVLRDRAAASARLRYLAREIVRRYGGRALLLFAVVLKAFLIRVSRRIAARIAADPNVAFVEQDRITWLVGSPRDRALRAAEPATHPPLAGVPLAAVPFAGTQSNPPSWGLDRIDQATLPLDNRFQYPNAQRQVNAYIVDSGIRASHQEFQGRAVAAVDFTDDGRNIDCNGHGTHVAGTIGGASVGVAKTVRLHGVRVFDCSGSGTMSDVLAAVEWITSKGKRPAVVNMSLGTNGQDPALDQALARSAQAGFLYAVAAGNNAGDACKIAPASSKYVISVGATNNRDQRDTSYSNYGKCVDVFAPGTGIVSAWSNGDNRYSTNNGTSMASPHAAGAAALVLSRRPNYTPWQVAWCLLHDSTNGVLSNVGPGSPNRMLRLGSSC